MLPSITDALMLSELPGKSPDCQESFSPDSLNYRCAQYVSLCWILIRRMLQCYCSALRLCV